MKHFPDIFINLIIPTRKLQIDIHYSPKTIGYSRKNNSYLFHANFSYKKASRT